MADGASPGSGQDQDNSQTAGLSRMQYPFSKRLFDLTFSAAALSLTWPLILAGMLAVKLTSPGSAIYRAKRVGQGGRPFTMFKLRTMRTGTDTPDRRVTAADDDRITPVGQVLRKLKVDELPQFWNVLRGDMSVVGPRPEDWEVFQRYYTPEYRGILSGRPGIVSPVDLKWYPDLTYHDPPPPDISPQEWYVRRHLPLQVAEGLRYLERQSLLLDATVVLQTALSILVYSFLKPPKRPLSADLHLMVIERPARVD
jgi:lipopolysaccharide/colanic/teichoic acid biosynthesis glycosyltransferase